MPGTYEVAMRRALELALRGPAWGVNPQVGAIILDPTGHIVAEGWHMGSGTAHAEVMALSSLSLPLEPGYTAVVTLEPCNHTGKTGPCAEALIAAGISKVVYGASDPGAASGGGAARLRDAGIEILGHVLLNEVEDQSRVWLKANRLGRPYVSLKWAQTLDGRAAASDGSSKWISGPESRAHAHRLREQCDAILVGTGTALADNPELTARGVDGNLYAHQPLRVVLGNSTLPADLRIFNSDAETIRVRNHDLGLLLAELWQRGVKHLLVEGGPTVAAEFVRAGLVDEFVVYQAPMLLGGVRTAITELGVGSIGEAIHLSFKEVKHLGADIYMRAERIG